MKKILAMLFGIMMICSICSAAYVPDPNRWYRASASDKDVFYLDTQAIGFSKESDGTHAVVWIISVPQNGKGETRTLRNWDFNLSRRESRMISYQEYKANGNPGYHNSYTAAQSPFKGILPGSVQEQILETLYTIYNMKNR